MAKVQPVTYFMGSGSTKIIWRCGSSDGSTYRQVIDYYAIKFRRAAREGGISNDFTSEESTYITDPKIQVLIRWPGICSSGGCGLYIIAEW
jgi:hypothetical protein